MPIDPATLLTLANDLANAPPGVQQQAAYRTAVNRGYYACLLRVIMNIEANNRPHKARTSGTHGWVKTVLDKSKRNGLLEIKHRLRGLEDVRDDADYIHDSPNYSQTEVGDVVARAQQLMTYVQGNHPWGNLPYL